MRAQAGAQGRLADLDNYRLILMLRMYRNGLRDRCWRVTRIDKTRGPGRQTSPLVDSLCWISSSLCASAGPNRPEAAGPARNRWLRRQNAWQNAFFPSPASAICRLIALWTVESIPGQTQPYRRAYTWRRSFQPARLSPPGGSTDTARGQRRIFPQARGPSCGSAAERLNLMSVVW